MKNKLLFIGLLLLVPFWGISQPVEKACFSVPGGFYEESPVLELFPFYQQHHIRYTTNGNRPTAQSRLYTEPLLLDESLYSTSDIYTIVNSPEDEFFLPDSIQHCIVIRAAVFDQNENCISEVSTNSYFIRSLGCDTHGLPAVSLCADSLDLFDFQSGIFVPGAWFDPLDPNWSGNYYQTGMDWEKPINMEFYELNNTGVNQRAGLRTHGGNGRRFQQKCVKVYAREEYGNKRFEHRFFESIPNDSFKHLVLKPFCASWNKSGVNNYLCNQIAAQLNIESLASRPIDVYLNGEYWGIYYIHERPDERYLEDHFDIDPERVNIISGWYPHLANGSLQHFLDLIRWFQSADLTDSVNYAYASTQMDMDNFIDYQIFELFTENTDWPANNMRCWQIDDGKWRWIFFDGDACLQWLTYSAFDNSVYDGDGTWPSSRQATLFFRKLLENVEFKARFTDRFLKLLDTAFDYSVTGPMMEAIKTTLQPEVPFQIERFGFPESIDQWNDAIGNTTWFLLKRTEHILDPLNTFLNGNENLQVEKFKCYPNPSSGEIHVQFEIDYFGTTEIAIFDLLGRKVYTRTCSVTRTGFHTVIQPNLTPGIYLLRTCNQAVKLVIQ